MLWIVWWFKSEIVYQVLYSAAIQFEPLFCYRGAGLHISLIGYVKHGYCSAEKSCNFPYICWSQIAENQSQACKIVFIDGAYHQSSISCQLQILQNPNAPTPPMRPNVAFLCILHIYPRSMTATSHERIASIWRPAIPDSSSSNIKQSSLKRTKPYTATACGGALSFGA